MSGRQTAPNPIKLLSYAEMVALPEGEFLIQGVYDATVEERSYLQKLSHTYVLLLLLKNEPRIVEYFKSLSSKFVLYVGTDFLVRALSAQCLLLAQGLGGGGCRQALRDGEIDLIGFQRGLEIALRDLHFAFVVLASPQIVRRITANRSPQSGQPAKFLLIRRESLTGAPH